MASLVKKHQDSPFHLIFGDCQRIGKEKMMEYMKSQGFSDELKNFTLSQFPNHPSVKGNGYVPYYMVFDHTGKLRYDHMCGKYHGGDGMKCVEWVDALVAEVPAIYFGEGEFKHHADLVAELETGKNLAKGVKKVETALAEVEAGSESEAELTRIHGVLQNIRDKELNRIEKLRATDPESVLDALKDLESELKGTKLGESVTARHEELSKSDEHKAEKKIGDKYLKYKEDLDDDSLSDKQREKLVGKAAKALRKLTADNPDLPISKTVEAWLTEIGAPAE